MLVRLKISSHYVRNRLPTFAKDIGDSRLHIPEGATVGDVMARLGLAEDESQVFVVVVNGRSVDRRRVLREGDELHILPPLGGG